MLDGLTRRASSAFMGLGSSLWSTGAAAELATPVQARARLNRWRAATRTDAQPHPASWDLVADERAVRAAGARVLYLFGQVLDFDGQPRPGVRIDIWQRGLDGASPTDSKTAAETAAEPIAGPFRAAGSILSDDAGHYRFRTVRPVACELAAPVLNARLTPPTGRVLDTQLFLLDEPANERDWLFHSLGPARQAALSIDPIERRDGDLEAGFNFVI